MSRVSRRKTIQNINETIKEEAFPVMIDWAFKRMPRIG